MNNWIQEQPMHVHIRWMIRRDMEQVERMEREGSIHPWSEEDYLTLLRQRNCIGMVAENEDLVVATMVYELMPDELLVQRFLVAPVYRRHGVGQQMLTKVISKMSSHRRNRLHFRVRETNLDLQLFLRHQGFLATELLRCHYDDTGEDAIHFEYTLPSIEEDSDERTRSTC